ncbi:MAG TPA: hypothetical protein DIU07_11270 [Rhodobacteraceae bacterium]|nr:hypothetical protein [Paracoccaceae bacterium]
MTATVIAFAGRNANRNTAPLHAIAATEAAERHDNIVPMAAWLGRARPRRTPTGVFFTTHVLATPGFTA